MQSDCSQFIDELKNILSYIGFDVDIKLKRLNILTQYGGKLYLTIRLINESVHNHIILADTLHNMIKLPIQIINNEYVFPLDRIQDEDIRFCLDDYNNLRHSTS